MFQYQKLLNAEEAKRTIDLEKRLQIFSALSVLSFSTLSYHMLSYLIGSYQDWAGTNRVLLPQRILGNAGIVGRKDQRVELHIWEWLTSSTLFQDFAITICNDSARFWWTQQALLVSMAWSVFMSFEGLFVLPLQAKLLSLMTVGRKRSVPHLWAYAFISQILPVSFAQNLFFLAMLLKPVSNPNQQIWTPTPIIQLLPLVAYYSFVLAAPFVAGTGTFIGVVIFIRLLLVAPLILPAVITEGGGQSYLTPRKAHWADAGPFKFIGICSALLWFLQTFVALNNTGFDPSRIINSLNDNSAVSALGYDYILSLASFGTWALVVGQVLV